jgi:hypothetical protein
VFGCTIVAESQLDSVFSNTDAILPPTKAWVEQDTAMIIWYKKETLFTEGQDGAHDLCCTINNFFLKSGHKRLQWKGLFKDLVKKDELNDMEQNALRLAMKMAKTDPKILDGWKYDVLLENDLTAAWSGAYQLLGGAWNTGVRFDKQPTSALKEPKYSKASPAPHSPPQAKTAMAVEKEIQLAPANLYYVVKKAPVAPKGKSAKNHWTQVT